MAETKNIIIAVIGYVLDFIIPLIGFLYGLILFFTKKEEPYFNKHSKFIMILAIVLWIVNIIIRLYIGPAMTGG